MRPSVKHGKDSGTTRFAPILKTKLYRPQLTSELIDRERLIPMMNRAREVPLTLVSAPAGYGKSTLVAQWAEQLDNRSTAPSPGCLWMPVTAS